MIDPVFGHFHIPQKMGEAYPALVGGLTAGLVVAIAIGSSCLVVANGLNLALADAPMTNWLNTNRYWSFGGAVLALSIYAFLRGLRETTRAQSQAVGKARRARNG